MPRDVLSQSTADGLAVKHLDVFLTKHVSPVYVQLSGLLDPAGADGMSCRVFICFGGVVANSGSEDITGIQS